MTLSKELSSPSSRVLSSDLTSEYTCTWLTKDEEPSKISTKSSFKGRGKIENA